MIFSRHTPSRIASAFFALLLAMFLVPLGAASSASAAEADTIHGLVNQARWDDGQLGLIRNAEMDAVALAWAKKMAASNNMSHNPNYSDQIPTGWRSAGENVAQGYRTAQAMHDGWMSSQGHRENILGAFTDIGIAFYTSGGTTWGVQVFATYPGHTGPDAASAAPAPAPEPSEESSETATSSASPTPTPTATDAGDSGAGSNSSSGSSADGTIGEIDADAAPTLTQAELQASVYGTQPDYTWISWTIFFTLLAVGGGFWFVVWRRLKSRRPVARRARQ
ncbi:CAP domain-containing protein [Salinibacterium sp. NSLL150]|uniref:CAP domain-containing protein n=1 Tax=unclassified Salinibacterium TaxID=2632331 RepID=UPI0018CDA3F3|nr:MULTISPECIES: CAP domain-containing protein [unclassified Salinibacterium]MBH0100130.1 CAP domain-containing protein [Salinibacterium sp. NSLL35]MBH0102884.1 CAP domain-containing protein [Salinibacterium sp. NSLL150]MBH0105644.1 CAP domain-containing protein [Salinibacterium sp. NSLL16]MBH0108404.1 CAP domain-containing protein [Salinibacterium sp. NSLL17]MBH0111182.1 CAP domain-containing protein [Salinibacterium sp. NG22]